MTGFLEDLNYIIFDTAPHLRDLLYTHYAIGGLASCEKLHFGYVNLS